MAMIGEIKLFAGPFAPVGWRFCDGSALDFWHASTLHSIIGTSFGETNNWDEYSLPNLPPVKDVDGVGESRYIICVEGEYPEKPA